jgi:hypothetical protein
MGEEGIEENASLWHLTHLLHTARMLGKVRTAHERR